MHGRLLQDVDLKESPEVRSASRLKCGLAIGPSVHRIRRTLAFPARVQARKPIRGARAGLAEPGHTGPGLQATPAPSSNTEADT